MKRIVSMLLAVMMIISIVPAVAMAEETSSFTDVKGTEYYASAAEVLAQLGVLTGYEDGSFGADKTITRAEMAAVISRMMGMEADAEKAKGETKFTDVSLDHWASGYVNAVSNKGIISGYGDGTFGPENAVLYEEAVKMVICALGLDKGITVDAADWSAAYIKAAKDKAITTNLKGEKGKALVRGDIAVLVAQGMSYDLAMPTASVATGEYSATQKVSLTTDTEGAVIYYTTDGTEPTVKSTKYEKEISISKTTTLKAVTVKKGVLVSDVLVVEYVINKVSSGGGGGGSSNKANVTFNLNYTGATGAPTTQSIKKGECATEPEEPQREGYVFGGWYTEKECENLFNFETPISKKTVLYAKWYEEGYQISAMEISVEDMNAAVEYTSQEDVQLVITFYEEDRTTLIGSVLADAETSSEIGEYNVINVDIAEITLPEFFFATADMYDAEGNMLCRTYSTIHHTQLFAEFMGKTIYDFEDKTVLNFDEQEDMNFAVLSEEVVEIDSEEDVNVLDAENSNIDEFIYEFDNINDGVRNAQVGDRLFIDKEEDYLITVAEITIDGDTAIIVAEKEYELTEYFDFIKVDMVLEPEESEVYVCPEFTNEENEDTELMATPIDVSTSIANLVLSIPIDYGFGKNADGDDSDDAKGKLHGSVSVDIKPTIKILWEVSWGESYFEIGASATVKATFDVGVEISYETGTQEDITSSEDLEIKIPLPSISVPFAIPGLTANIETSIPVSIEAKANFHYVGTVALEASGTFDSRNGFRHSKKVTKERELVLDGEVEIKFGPQFEESITFLHDKIKISLEENFGIKIEVEGVWTIHENVMSDENHACAFCVAAGVSVYAELNIKISYKLTKHISGTPVDLTLWDAEWPWFECYYSSDTDFAIGTCKNIKYRTYIKVVDANGIEIPGAKVQVLKGGAVVETADAPLMIYLKNGDYVANAIDGAETIGTLGFSVASSSQTIEITSNAETGTIEGHVATADDRSIAVPGAKVQIINAAGNEVRCVFTNESGDYQVDLAVGDYTIIVSKENYQTFRHNITIEADIVKPVETLLLVEGDPDDTAVIYGTVRNSVTGAAVPGATVVIYRDWNGEDGEYVGSTVTTANGSYEYELNIGNYSLVFSKEDYISSSTHIAVTTRTYGPFNGSMVPENSELIPEGELRIVLHWGATPSDIDSHLVGPTADGTGRFHTYYRNKTYSSNGVLYADLDLDDTSSYGPETTTIYIQNETGIYSFYLHDYTNKSESDSYEMSNSGAYVEVYAGAEQIAVFYIPANREGTLWKVFDYDAASRTITPYNILTNYYGDIGDIGLLEVDEDMMLIIEDIFAEEKELVEE